MQKIRDLIHYILLATTPSLFAHPGHFPSFEARETDWTEDGWDETPDDQIQETWKVPTTYGEVIDMLEDLECGTPEEKYSLAEFEKINNYVIVLARAGILPHQLEKKQELEDDIYDLLYGESSAFQLIYALENSDDHTIIPAVLQGTYANYAALQCGFLKKAWKKSKKVIKKVWKKTARFCKTHKKEIIIGTAAALGGGALFLACKKKSSTPAASAALGAAAATFHSNGDPFDGSTHEVSKPKPQEEQSATSAPCEESPHLLDQIAPPIQDNIERDRRSLEHTLQQERSPFESRKAESRDELPYSPFPPCAEPPCLLDPAASPILEEAVESYVISVKDALGQEESSFNSSKDESEFIETAKQIGPRIAHEIYEEITETVKIVPQFIEVMGELRNKLPSESVSLTLHGFMVSGSEVPDESTTPADREINLVEEYERVTFKGHQVIDHIFATDQAKDFTPEAKAHDLKNELTYGTLPFPGSSDKEAIKAGKSLSKAKNCKSSGKILDAAAHIGRNKPPVPLEKSKVFKMAKEQHRHATTVRDAVGKRWKENAKSIRSLKKNIAEHKEKMANPKKHWSDWDYVDQGKQNERLHHWATEIKGWEEQIEWLEAILEERLNYEE